jgi:hypothetical protein
MKKIILVWITLLFSTLSFSQVDINSLNEMDKKIVKTFRDIYVEKTFKDPYSFKLLKLETKPITLGDWSLKNINFLNSMIDKKDFGILKENEILERLKLLEKEYSEISDESKKLLKSIEVRLDCYGTNSYGGQILGRYSFNYVLIDRDLKPFNYYDKPFSFIVSELK